MKRLKSMLIGAVPAAFLLAAAAFAAPTPTADEAPPKPAGEWTAATAWTDSCAKCHGEDGKGDTKLGKKLRDEGKTMPDLTNTKTDPAKFVAIIRDGVKETKMKAYGDKLTEDQQKALADFVKAMKKG